MFGVRVDDAVRFSESFTTYVTAGCAPEAAPPFATYDTTPVVESSVNTPADVVTEVCVQFGAVSAGDTPHKNVCAVTRLGPPGAARPPARSRVVNTTVSPGRSVFCSDVAVGTGGATTVGEIVAESFCPAESATTYLIGVAAPVKVGSGSKETTPFASTE